jgi:predicted DNA-binding protein
MSVDRLSITVPSELGTALRALASARRKAVSTVVTEAIEHEIRQAALDHALVEADRRFGVLSEELIREAEEQLSRAAKKARRPRRRAG